MTKRDHASQSSNQSPSPASFDPSTYRALKTEQGVFTTSSYSGSLKVLWRYRDASTAEESARALFQRFETYRDKGDFVGMDMTRKFIQMGRTRSLRYAFRKGGKKYESSSSGPSESQPEGSESQDYKPKTHVTGRTEIPRTGQICDQGKLDGAQLFEGYLDRCWADEKYVAAWDKWRKAQNVATNKERPKVAKRNRQKEVGDKSVKSESDEEGVKLERMDSDDEGDDHHEQRSHTDADSEVRETKPVIDGQDSPAATREKSKRIKR